MRQWNISSDAEISKSINHLFRSYALVWYSLTKRLTTFNCASVFRSTSYKLECFSKLLWNPSIGHHQDIDQIHTWTIHNYSISYDHFIRVHDEDIVRRIDIIFYLYFIFCRFRVGSETRFSYEFYSIEAVSLNFDIVFVMTKYLTRRYSFSFYFYRVRKENFKWICSGKMPVQ